MGNIVDSAAKQKKRNPPKNTNFLLYRIHYYQGRAKTKIIIKERLQ
jgi:hypothetical protein